MRQLFFALLAGCTATTSAATIATPQTPTSLDIPDGTASVTISSPVDVDASGTGWQLTFHQRAHACVNIPAGTNHVSFTTTNRWTAAYSEQPCPETSEADNSGAIVGLLVGLML